MLTTGMLRVNRIKSGKECNTYIHRVHTGQGNMFFLQGQGKVREFCKMAREIRKSSIVMEKSGNF